MTGGSTAAQCLARGTGRDTSENGSRRGRVQAAARRGGAGSGGVGPRRDGARGSGAARESRRRRTSPGRREGETRRPASPVTRESPAGGESRDAAHRGDAGAGGAGPRARGQEPRLNRASPVNRILPRSHDLLDYYELGRKKPCGRGEPDGGGPVGVLRSVAGVWSDPQIELGTE